MEFREFSMHAPVPRRGLTSVEAAEFLGREFPEVPVWTCWHSAGMSYAHALQQFVGAGHRQEGEVAGYHWRRMKTAYPETVYFFGRSNPRELADAWIGVLEVQGSGGERFLLFSYLNSSGEIGTSMFASTTDLRLLERFGLQVAASLARQEDRVPVTVMGGRDFSLPPGDEGPLFLPGALIQDIEAQLHSFFEDKGLFSRLRLRRRRGLLFVGQPGNGKTLMVRHLVRLAHRAHGAAVYGLAIGKHIDEDDLDTLFTTAGDRGPSVVVLEDLDSLLRESSVTRAGLLSLLDGVDPREGVMVLATTNNPEEIDPAFAQRPSRFDRVWRFDPPDLALRRRYLDWAFGELPEEVRVRLAESSGGFSFAFLNELRVSAAILALRSGREEVVEQDALDALDLLTVQFKAGKKGYEAASEEGMAGFRQCKIA
jgi:hypothetical protein